jgi:hypothetical protein
MRIALRNALQPSVKTRLAESDAGEPELAGVALVQSDSLVPILGK